MNEENNHGGITVGAMGIINRNHQINKMIADVELKGKKSEYHKWYEGYANALTAMHQRKVNRYNKLPKWLKWIMKNPNK